MARFLVLRLWHFACTEPQHETRRQRRHRRTILPVLLQRHRIVETVPLGPKTSKIIEQLVDAAGSIGTNREEAPRGSSHTEFIRYNEISLKGANESLRWLRACAAHRLGSQDKCVPLLDEGRQLARILARIVITAKRREVEATNQKAKT
jgi:four helix bundle protein